MKKTILIIALMAFTSLSLSAQTGLTTDSAGKIVAPVKPVKLKSQKTVTKAKDVAKAAKPNVVSKPLVKNTGAGYKETYAFSKEEASLLFIALEKDKELASLSPDISARDANTIYLPRADSLQRILGRQLDKYLKAKEAKQKTADSLRVAEEAKAAKALKKDSVAVKK